MLVWRHLGGTVHRLQRTSSDSEDLPALIRLQHRERVLSGRRPGQPVRELRQQCIGNRGVRRDQQGDRGVHHGAPPAALRPLAFVPGVTGGGPGHFGGGAILRCSAPPAASCPTYEDVPVEITLLWSATLTVGERGSGTTVLGAGFNRGNSESDIGAISDDSFDLTGAPHVVTQLQIFVPNRQQ